MGVGDWTWPGCMVSVIRRMAAVAVLGWPAHRRIADELDAQVGALALAARHAAHAVVADGRLRGLGQPQLRHQALHEGGALLGAASAAQPQPRRHGEGLAHGLVGVEHVVLLHVCARAAEKGLVAWGTVHENLAA